MKKNKIFAIIAILAITISGVLVFQACKKGDIVNNDSNNESITFTSSTSDIENYLLDLRKRMKTATKDGEAIALSDAEWNLTALENFGFCDGSKRDGEMIVDTFYTTINVIDNNVSLYDLNIVYENNKKNILNKFNLLDGDDKNIYLINCHIDTVAKNGTTRVTTITSMRNGGSTMSNPMRFGPTDYWYDFDLKGKCGPYEGQCVGRDATTEMQSKIMANIGSISCEHGRIFYTNIYDYYADPRDFGCDCYDSPYPPDCLYTNYTEYYRCLSPEDLNWYLDKILLFIRIFDDSYIGNRSLTNVYVFVEHWLGCDSPDSQAKTGNDFWTLQLSFANVNCTQQPYDI